MASCAAAWPLCQHSTSACLSPAITPQKDGLFKSFIKPPLLSLLRACDGGEASQMHAGASNEMTQHMPSNIP